MTPENLAAHIDRQPFIPIRLHLASGATVDVASADLAWRLKHSLMVLIPERSANAREGRYTEINYRLIERIEQLPLSASA